MKWTLLIATLFLAVAASAQGPVLTPATPPAIIASGTQVINCTSNCTSIVYTCPGCSGTLSGATGTQVTYNAPATIHAAQSYGGYQLTPNDSIFNQRVDSLGVNASSATWIAGAGSVPFTIQEYSFPINYCNGSTPLVNMTFQFTSGSNGNFQLTPYPDAKIESGWLTRVQGALDHHWFCIDTTNGTFQEMYDVVPNLAVTGATVTSATNTAKLTFASDPRNIGYHVGGGAVVQGFGGAYTYLNVGTTTITAIDGTSVSFSITHANDTATTNLGILGFQQDCPSTGLDTCNAVSGIRYSNSTYNLPNAVGNAQGVDAAGLYLMPLEVRQQEMLQAIANSSTSLNHALRMTLQNGFICDLSTANSCGCNAVGTRHCWPATSEAFAGGGVVPYGAWFRLKSSHSCASFSSIAQIICNTLKQHGLILADGGTGWATQMEYGAWPANIVAAFAEVSAAAIPPTEFEAVDVSSLHVSDTSMATTLSETVVATATGGSTNEHVVLTGVTVGLPEDNKFVQAGTPGQQLIAFANGGALNTVTWSVSPSITGGSLSSSGVLTPPSTIAAATAYTVKATSNDDATVNATEILYILPTGSIYLRPGGPAPYTDASSHVWANIGGDNGNIGCCGDLSGGPWPVQTDIALYYYYFTSARDMYFKITVPNGTYKITGKFGTPSSGANTVDTIEAQGSIVLANQNINTLAGGTYKPIDLTVNSTTVTNNTLTYVIRQATSGAGNGTGGSPEIGAIQIDQTSTPPGAVPAAPSNLGILLLADYSKPVELVKGK